MKSRLSGGMAFPPFSLSPGISFFLLVIFLFAVVPCGFADAAIVQFKEKTEGEYMDSLQTSQDEEIIHLPLTAPMSGEEHMETPVFKGFPLETTASYGKVSQVSSHVQNSMQKSSHRLPRLGMSKSTTSKNENHLTTAPNHHHHHHSGISPPDLFLQIFMDYSVPANEENGNGSSRINGGSGYVSRNGSKRSRAHRSFQTAAVHSNENVKQSLPTYPSSIQIPMNSNRTTSSKRGSGAGVAKSNSTSSTFSTSSALPNACPVGHFACAKPTLCVPQSAICNGKQECPDGSDEYKCVNIHEKKFWDTFFQKRPAAEIDGDDSKSNGSCLYKAISSDSNEEGMDLNGQKLVGQDKEGKDDFHNLLAKGLCRCSQEKILCNNVHLKNLDIFPEEIKFLDLSGCRIDQLEFPAERFYQLQTLVLSSCSLREIGKETFSKLSNLRVLHLTGNHLRRIPPMTFAGNGNLSKLYLGHNHLSLDSQSFHGLEALEYLDLRKNRLNGEESSVFESLGSLRILHLSFNEIRRINKDFFSGLSKLEMLSMTKNKIASIDPGALNHFPLLKHLYLSYNRLSVLENEMFCHLQDLLNLNLNDNGIMKIEPRAFDCLDSLQSLILEKNPFHELKQDEVDGDPRQLFSNLTNLQHIYFDEWYFCWWAPHVRSCEPKGDGISSVENLLDNAILRVCVWIMGSVGVGGNLFVIISRLVIREKNKAHSFYIKNLAVADLLMGLFLISIAFHDMSFRGHFLAHQHAWRHSITCQLTGMLSTLSSEASVLILFLITLDRYLSIVRPFAERTNTVIPAIIVCAALWLISILLSYAPLCPIFKAYFGRTFYTSNGLCLPLHIHNPYETGWEYSLFLFIIVNSVAFTFICYAYWKMLRIIQMSTTSIRSTQQKQDGLLVKRFGLVVLTDFMCWAPIITIKIVAMCGVEIQADLYAWLAVFILPVNSALNPVLYTLSTKLFKQQVSHFTVGFRKRLGLATDDSTTSSFLYRNRISRTLQTSLNSSMMLSTRRQHAAASTDPNNSSHRGTLIKDRVPNRMSAKVSSYSPPTAGNSPVRVSATATSASGGGCHVIPYATSLAENSNVMESNGQKFQEQQKCDGSGKEVTAESQL